MQIGQSDLRSLAVFRSVVEHGSFAGAQISLGLSQSAVSFHIKALEDRFGFALCRRGRSGFELTDRGSVVYERSKALYLALNSFESDIGKLKNKITGTLRLGLIDNTVTDHELPLPKVIARIGKKAPEARIEITVGHPEALLTEIAVGGLDLAILPYAQPFRGIKTTPFKEELHVLYCAEGHALFQFAPEDVTQDLVETFDFVVRPYANRQELEFFPNAKTKAFASNMEAQAMFIMSGCFLGYLPEHYARQWVNASELKPILAATTALKSPFVIATRQEEKSSNIMDLFMQELAGLASEALHKRTASRIVSP
ncbi:MULTISPECIES: LysR family transcriptional regulator [Agrobacterium]|uniref:LysR family transcriptional regulator n=1 Tax=Agrobacterium pusense TaxID=648995 RepID=A0AA44EGW0_9HYPH|nr:MULTISPECIES: LysR family transcriptional regulator [Agrobacterium]KNY30905.1 transcriptional regulator [Agrobacterium sp. SUL3]MDH0617070.1 LysR family transcriptional regulator [Agrobacterium sp. GD03872]MDH0699800.1 LysR family transcriptional regulator [Agrobacterium sp. GD03871]MDH1062697.1 LysR family transcriptional regulator [Agrobacterium sp. GD03992]MDH2213987.1 LysR family transcriptional regulator [Agrobacterium sp. GD03643]